MNDPRNAAIGRAGRRLRARLPRPGAAARAERDRTLEGAHRLGETVRAHGGRLDHLRAQLAAQRTRLSRHGARLDAHGARLDAQRARLDAQRARIEKLEDGVTELTPVVGGLTVTYAVMEHQIQGLEERLADLLVDGRDVDPGTEGDRAEAREILAEVRTEHARIRSRFEIVASYEERIRRLEIAVRPKPG